MADMQTIPGSLIEHSADPLSIAMNIGTTIRGYRLQKGMSQGDIEKRTGLLRCYLSRVENGHTVPSLETLQKNMLYGFRGQWATGHFRWPVA